jgi:hypothetical protein
MLQFRIMVRHAAMVILFFAIPSYGQVDQQQAAGYFREVAALCEREGGRLWGVSLCGPLALVDAATQTIAANHAVPEAAAPAGFGFANFALDWGGTRWSTVVWRMIPADAHLRGQLFLHELFHRIQPQIGFQLRDGQNEHLDTLDGRYWLQLEWRALAKALGSAGDARNGAVRDALAFRAARRALAPGAAENERLIEINEGLAQYTGTVASAESRETAEKDAVRQLDDATKNATFVRTFAYPQGAAYGLLLDACSAGWTRRVKPTDDLGALLATASGLAPAPDAAKAAADYGGGELRAAEEKREAAQKVRVAELRRRFVEGPVLTVARSGSFSFTNAGMTPIPGAGTVYPTLRTTAEWGKLEAENALVNSERGSIAVPGPVKVEGATLSGPGWTLQLAAGWTTRPGSRAGDLELAKQ